METPKSNGLRFIFLGLLVTALFCLAMCGVTLRRTITNLARGGQEANIGARPSPFRGNATSELAAARMRLYAGRWMGNAPVRDQGICSLIFELRDRTDVRTPFSGYTTLTCMGMSGSRAAANPFSAMLQRSPRSAILIGAPAGGGISFRVDRLIGTGEDCPMTGFTALPFGTTQLAAQWQSGACPGGDMLLNKVGQ